MSSNKASSASFCLELDIHLVQSATTKSGGMKVEWHARETGTCHGTCHEPGTSFPEETFVGGDGYQMRLLWPHRSNGAAPGLSLQGLAALDRSVTCGCLTTLHSAKYMASQTATLLAPLCCHCRKPVQNEIAQPYRSLDLMDSLHQV